MRKRVFKKELKKVMQENKNYQKEIRELKFALELIKYKAELAV